MSQAVKNILILAYLVILVGTVLFTGRKNRSVKQFFQGDSSLPWLIVAGNITATMVGGAVIVGYPGSFFAQGLVWLWIPIGNIILALLLIFLAPRIKGLGKSSVSEMLELRFGTATRTLSAWIYIIGELGVVISMTMAMSSTLATLTGYDVRIMRLVSVCIFALAASLGGIKGVAITNAVQAAVIVLGMVALGILSVHHVGGFSALFSSVPAESLRLTHSDIPGATMFGNVISAIAMGLVMQSAFYQNIAACKDKKDATKAQTGYLVNIILLFGSIAVIGLAAQLLLPSDTVPDTVIVVMSQLLTTPAVALFFNAVVLASIITSGNGMMLSVSLSFAKNIYPSLCKKEVSDKQTLMMSRVFIVICAVIAYIISSYFTSVISITLVVYTIIGIMVVPVFCGFFMKKGGSYSGFGSTLAGALSVVVWEVLGRPLSLHPIIIAIPVSFIVYLLLMNVGPQPTEKNLAIVEQFKHNA